EAQRAGESAVELDRVAAQVAEQGQLGLALGGDDGAGSGVSEVEGGCLGSGLRDRGAVGGRLRSGCRLGLRFAAPVLSPPGQADASTHACRFAFALSRSQGNKSPTATCTAVAPPRSRGTLSPGR